MARERISGTRLTCDEAGAHDGPVKTIQVTFRSDGAAFEIDLCDKHEQVVPVSALRTYGRPGGRRKPADRPQGIAGMTTMLRE